MDHDNDHGKEKLMAEAAEELKLPRSAYEKAAERYEDLGEHLSREDSKLHRYDPHVFAQGSFRIGTAIRPLSGDEDYDLDLAIELRQGVDRQTHSQEELKEMTGEELEAYRSARKIEGDLEAKHRCWRLPYKGEIGFHMDQVPCIPCEQADPKLVTEMMQNEKAWQGAKAHSWAEEAGARAVFITDDRHPGFKERQPDWQGSNPEGYAVWFESRMYTTKAGGIDKLRADVEPLPKNQFPTPLRRAVQFLKRHRDQMFRENQDVQPISIIITTLAGMAYEGEETVGEALANILDNMESLVQERDGKPWIPNPVDPRENFADRWLTPEGRKLDLYGNFKLWLKQVRQDFQRILSSREPGELQELLELKLSVKIGLERIRRIIGGGGGKPPKGPGGRPPPVPPPPPPRQPTRVTDPPPRRWAKASFRLEFEIELRASGKPRRLWWLL